jgi:hypothetical protein
MYWWRCECSTNHEQYLNLLPKSQFWGAEFAGGGTGRDFRSLTSARLWCMEHWGKWQSVRYLLFQLRHTIPLLFFLSSVFHSKFGWWQHSGKHQSFLQLSVYSTGYMPVKGSLSWNCLWYSSTTARVFLLQNSYKAHACLFFIKKCKHYVFSSIPYCCTSVTYRRAFQCMLAKWHPHISPAYYFAPPIALWLLRILHMLL